MDFLLPLTIIGFIISFYSISEKYKKRNFIFKFDWIDKSLLFILIVALIFTILLQNFYTVQKKEPSLFFYNDIKNNCYNVPYSYAFSVLGFLLAFVIIVYMLAKLNSKKLSQKTRFINDAIDKLNRKKFDELSADLELYHNDLLKSYKRPKIRHFYFLKYLKYVLKEKFNCFSKKNKIKYKQNKLLSYESFKKEKNDVYGRLGHIFDNLNTNSKKTITQKVSFFINKFRFIANRKTKYCDLVDEFYYELNTNNDFLEFITENNLNLMFKLLDNKLPYRKADAWQVIGTYLISHKESILYKELNANYSGKKCLLNFLFEKPIECEKWLVWKPIGDYVINYIRDQRKNEIDENNYFEERYDIVKNSSPIFIGIKFFEVMVNEALEKSTADHMFLNYTGFFAEKILKNISYEDGARGEFANMYEYYLYEIFSNHNNWIDYISDYDKYEVKFYDDHGPNIVQFAIFSFSSIMKDVFESTKLRDDFKNYLREIFIESYFNLANSQKQSMDKYANYFLKCIKERIVDYRKEDNQPFIAFLKYPVQHYRNRTVWDRGVHYSSELRSSFIQFLDSLNKGDNQNDI